MLRASRVPTTPHDAMPPRKSPHPKGQRVHHTSGYTYPQRLSIALLAQMATSTMGSAAVPSCVKGGRVICKVVPTKLHEAVLRIEGAARILKLR